MKASLLPSHFLEKIDPADRAEMGKAGMTAAEAVSKQEREEERKLRNQCLAFCSRKELLIGTAADHKKSTYTTGWADLSIILPRGLTLYLELKTSTGSLSYEQINFMETLLGKGHHHHVIRSYPQFLEVMRSYGVF